jgi:hypothetical protein
MRRILSVLSLLACFAGVTLADILYTFTGSPGGVTPTITQFFELTTPAAITSLLDLNVAALDSSSNVFDVHGLPYGVEFDPLDTMFGFNTNADVIRVGFSLHQSAFYYFPIGAFTTPGEYSSIGPAFNNVATLTVSSVPEPESIVFLGTVVAILVRRRIQIRR